MARKTHSFESLKATEIITMNCKTACRQMLAALTIAMALCAASLAGAAESPSSDDTREAVVAYFLGGDEPTVEAASWTSDTEFAVGVHYMGSSENGFARYVCSILAKRGLAAGASVHVVDINTMGPDPKRWQVVGEAMCKG